MDAQGDSSEGLLPSALRFITGWVAQLFTQKERSCDGRHMMGRQAEHVIHNEVHGFCSLRDGGSSRW